MHSNGRTGLKHDKQKMEKSPGVRERENHNNENNNNKVKSLLGNAATVLDEPIKLIELRPQIGESSL